MSQSFFPSISQNNCNGQAISLYSFWGVDIRLDSFYPNLYCLLQKEAKQIRHLYSESVSWMDFCRFCSGFSVVAYQRT